WLTFDFSGRLVALGHLPRLRHPPEPDQSVDNVRSRRQIRVVDGKVGQERFAGKQVVERHVRPAKAQLELAESDHRPGLVNTHAVLLRQLRSLPRVSSTFVRAALERIKPCESRDGTCKPREL